MYHLIHDYTEVHKKKKMVFNVLPGIVELISEGIENLANKVKKQG